MSPQEYDIYHYLNRTPDQFVSLYEIVKNIGGNRSFANGRYWALESLQRMADEGLVEKNDTEEFRIRREPDGTAEVVRSQPGQPLQSEPSELSEPFEPSEPSEISEETERLDRSIQPIQPIQLDQPIRCDQPDDTTEFLRALNSPGVSLGDTAIITIRDVRP